MSSDGEILRVRPAADDPDAWDAALAQAPGGGHIYQSFAWGEFKRRRGWRPLRAVLLHGDRPAGAGQILVRSLGPIGSLAYCPKGPWLDWDRPEHVRVFFEGLESMLRARGVFLLRVEPEVHEARRDVRAQLGALGFRRGRWNQQFKTTMFVDLARPEAEILASMKAQTRRNIRIAARHGVTVHEDSRRETRDEFFRLFQETARRDGFFMRPREYIMGGWDALIEAGRGSVFVARHDGRMLAAMFACTFGTKFWYKDGASSSVDRHLMPTYALQWEVMRAMRARGIATYDMVAVPDPDKLQDPSDSMHGLYRFKAGFGGTVTEFMREMVRFYRPRTAELWYRLEPLTYRVYKRLMRDVYY